MDHAKYHAKPLMNTPVVLTPDTTIEIDGESIPAETGEPLIEAVNRMMAIRQWTFPQVCYLKPMGHIGSCDTCMVQLGNGELVRACETRVEPGQTVFTRSDRADVAQREAFDRILHHHDLYCTVCDNNNGNCTVHNTTKELAVIHQVRPFERKGYAKDFSNPFYRYDPDQCILCGRCVEACQNVQVNETLTIDFTREQPRVLWDGGEQIAGSSCVSCGHCVSVCPCNALMEKGMLGRAGYLTSLPTNALDEMIEAVKKVEPSTGFPPILALSEVESEMRHQRVKRTKTVCTYCGVGCSFDIWTRDRHILKVEPMHGPANGISTCIKGKFAWDFVNSGDRLRKPLKRQDHTFVEIEWDEAIQIVADNFTKIKNEHGPDALAFVASSKCSNEESYLIQKLARAVIGTNNIDNCSRYCQTPASKGLSRTVGYGGDSGSIADIEMADLVIIVGSNTAESHPVLATRVKRSHKHRGQRLIVSDLRENEMAERADLHIRPNPSTDEVWLSAVTKHLIDTGRHNQAFIDKWVNKWEEYRNSLARYTLEYAEQVTGIPVPTLMRIADEIAAAKNGVCILWAMGVTQHCGGSDTSTSICNLLLATGNFKRRGTGAYPLRGHNNVQGTSDFGSMPDVFSGYQKVDNENIRANFEAAWAVALPTTVGKDNRQMIEAIHEGKLKSLYITGEDTITSDANANDVAEAFAKLDFMVVQDIFFSETCRYADIVLPACPSLEKEGTFVSTERRIQRFHRAFEPLGDSKPDWQIYQLIAQKLGGAGGWDYKYPGDVMTEVAKLTPIFAGVSYDRLEGYNTLQWPVDKDGHDQPCLYLGDETSFPFPDGKASFFPLEYVPPSEEANDTYDLHLNNGRLLEHFEQGNLTYRVPGVMEITPEVFVEVSPELAKERGLDSGQWVQLDSPYGFVRVKVLVTHRVVGRQMYMPLNSFLEPVNKMTSSHLDRATHTPAYKELSVKMTVLPEKGESPLPRDNFRFGSRTPTDGVNIAARRARADYYTPGTRPKDKLVQIETMRPT